VTKRELGRLLDLLGKLSEQPYVDGTMRDDIARIRDLLWDMVER
jgi:hypothetical protein